MCFILKTPIQKKLLQAALGGASWGHNFMLI